MGDVEHSCKPDSQFLSIRFHGSSGAISVTISVSSLQAGEHTSNFFDTAVLCLQNLHSESPLHVVLTW